MLENRSQGRNSTIVSRNLICYSMLNFIIKILDYNFRQFRSYLIFISNSKTLIKIHEFLINSFTSTTLKQFKSSLEYAYMHTHAYIYTYVFIKKRRKTIFFCISNLTTKRRIEISPNVIQTVWFNSKQRYTRM